jgi:hypothetical protein
MRKLNLVINGLDSYWGARTTEEALKPFPIGYCLTFCPKEHLPRLAAEEHVWHPLYAFREIDWSTIPPLDEALIEQMRECEAVMMEIMTRHERKGTKRRYEERKRWYLMHLRYWNHILEAKKIDLFLCWHTPHHNRTYALYSLCKLKGIPVFFYYQGPTRGTLFFVEDWEDSSLELRDRYKELLEKFGRSEEPIPLSPRFEEYYQTHVSAGKDATPWYISEPEPDASTLWRNDVHAVLRSNLPLFLRKAAMFALRPLTPRFWERRAERRAGRKMFRFYDEHAAVPDFSKRYVYVPLQFQPEASSVPSSGVFCNQLLMVQLLSACLPPDILLYVKEYPRQKAFGRDMQFYRDLLAVRGVRFVPRDTSTYRLMEGALAVATGTSTAGFEALFRGKPVLMFGHDYYQYAPGVFRIHSADDCRSAVAAILRNEAAPRLRDLRIYLRAMEDVTVPAHLGERFRLLPEEENTLVLGGDLAERIRKRFVAIPSLP